MAELPVTPGAIPPAASAPAAAAPAQAPKPTAPAAAPAPAAGRPAVPASPTPQAGGSQVPLSALMEERDRRQALQSELESLRNQVQLQRQPVAPTGGYQPQQAPQQDIRAELEELWKTDPRKAVQREIMLAAQWQDNINAQVDGEAEQLTAKYADFNDYRNTAMRYVRALPLDQRSRPGIVEMAYLVTRGQNVDKIIEAQRASLQSQFQQNPAMFQTPAGSLAGGNYSGNNTSITDDEMAVARAMKMSPEDYLRYKK